MTAAFFATLLVGIVVVALLLVWLRDLRRARDQAVSETSAAGGRAEEAERLRHEGEAAARQEIAALTARVEEVEEAMAEQAASAEARTAELEVASRQQAEELERGLRRANGELGRQTAAAEAATARAAEAEAAATARTAELATAVSRAAALEAQLAAQGVTPDPGPGAGPVAVAEGGEVGWRLLLTRVERQWAEVVNAGPDERGLVDGSRSEQLAQAVGHELERLREEVGVEASLVVAGETDAEHSLTTLLGVGEVVALLASRSEHITVELRPQPVVTGQDWTGDEAARRRLDQVVALTADGGRSGTVEALEGALRVVLGTGP